MDEVFQNRSNPDLLTLKCICLTRCSGSVSYIISERGESQCSRWAFVSVVFLFSSPCVVSTMKLYASFIPESPPRVNMLDLKWDFFSSFFFFFLLWAHRI